MSHGEQICPAMGSQVNGGCGLWLQKQRFELQVLVVLVSWLWWLWCCVDGPMVCSYFVTIWHFHHFPSIPFLHLAKPEKDHGIRASNDLGSTWGRRKDSATRRGGPGRRVILSCEVYNYITDLTSITVRSIKLKRLRHSHSMGTKWNFPIHTVCCIHIIHIVSGCLKLGGKGWFSNLWEYMI